MSNIPICRLCGCTPIRLIDGSVKHDEYASRCSLRLSVLTGEQWQQLMGGGEPVGFRHRANDHSEWVTVFGRSPDSYELRELEIEALYSRPQAAQVDGAVLRDAALFRWLIDGPRSGPVWNNVLTEEQRYGHCDIRAAIIAAMKGEG